MKIDERTNKYNIELFKRYGLNNEDDNFYTCVCCGKQTCINCSTSIKGAYLVCNRCVYDKFGSYHKCSEWQDEMMTIAQEIYEWKKEIEND